MPVTAEQLALAADAGTDAQTPIRCLARMNWKRLSSAVLLTSAVFTVAGCSASSPSVSVGAGAPAPSATALPLAEWLAAFCQDAASAAQDGARDEMRPTPLNGTAEELGNAQAVAGQFADLDRKAADAWGRPVTTDIESMKQRAAFNAASATWGAKWWDEMRAKTRSLEPAAAVKLWRATDSADESFDRNVLLSLNTDPLPPAPALGANVERDGVEMQAMLDKIPGCSANFEALNPVVPQGAIPDSP